MGNFFGGVIKNLYEWFFQVKKINASICGLNFAGKSTLTKALCLERIKEGEYDVTMNVDVKVFKKNNCSVTVYDMGGQKRFRKKWLDFVGKSDALIYMIDSSDKKRIDESYKEFEYLLPICKEKNLPILVVSNKIDLEGHMKKEFIAKKFKIANKMENSELPVLLIETSVLKFLHVEKILQWLVKIAK